VRKKIYAGPAQTPFLWFTQILLCFLPKTVASQRVSLCSIKARRHQNQLRTTE
jgi:hypothetical protein